MEYKVQDLLKRISELEAELKATKKYGLVWDKEKNKEKVVEKYLTNIPFLCSVPDKTIGEKGLDNLLIEGDNFYSLTCLNFIYENYVDIIYIDPPYNTGEKDFTYNDDYVDKEDTYRHSKWLNFMEKRLELARNIMKEDAVLFLSIGDDEVNNIGLLLNNIFGERNFIGLLPRIGKKSGKTTSTIAKNHDYVYIYAKNKDLVTFARQVNERDESKLEKDQYYSERGAYRLNQCLDYDSLTYSTKMDYPLEIDGVTFYPGGSKEEWEKRQSGNHKKFDWTWRWSPSLVKFGLDNDFIVIKKGKRPRIYTKTYTNVSIELQNGQYKIVKTEDLKSYNSLEFVDNKYSNDNAKKELANIGLKDTFDFPKPSSLVKTCINMTGKKNPVVLDFFAGSGTTGQAVLELNKQDGGNRKFILCTNNENGICENVTYSRIATTITGKTKEGKEYSEGTDGILRYYTIDLLLDSKNNDQAKYNLVEKVDSLLCIKEEIFDFVERNDHSSHYMKKNKHLFIYNDYYNEAKFNEFKKKVLSTNGERIVYLFSFDNTVASELFSESNVVVKPIPSKIYEIYREIVESIKRGD